MHRVQKKGFSLIECVIVIAIVATVTSLISLSTSFIYRSILHAEVDLLASHMLHLQHTALITRQPQTLRFNLVEHTYSWDTSTYQLPHTVRFGILPNVKGPPSHPQTMLATSCTFTDDTIIFFPDGIIKSGTIYLIDNQRKSLCALTSGVAQVSFLRKYRYDGKWHLIAS